MLGLIILYIVQPSSCLKYNLGVSTYFNVVSKFPGYSVNEGIIVESVGCTLYSVQFTMYSVQCTVYSVQCTMYSVQCTAYSVHCTLYTVQSVTASKASATPR